MENKLLGSKLFLYVTEFFAGVLAAIGIVYFAFARKKMLKGIVAAVVIVGLCFTLPTYSFAFWENDIALEDESIYTY